VEIAIVPYSDSSILNDGNTASAMNIRCHRFLALFLLLLIYQIATPAFAQAPVVASRDPESLFTSADARLNANKQVVLHIVRDLLEANHWSDADKYRSERYLQHNPFVASGLAPVKRFFAERPATQIPAKMKAKGVSVVADGDLVVVAFKQEYADPRNPGKCCTTTWFDMWRIVDGKADEHWDAATLTPPATKPCH
jgi:predicted SnoaL-like aldol condensation-catalyzing enzyme